jgi:serine/threonine-protein kinase
LLFCLADSAARDRSKPALNQVPLVDHTQTSPLPVGSVFQARYEVVRCINAGGMGIVYEAIHLETRRRTALKIMLPSVVANREMRARFKLEATVAANIESEHIVETLDAGVDAGTGAPFIVMELLRGEDLSVMLQRRGRFSAAETVTLLMQIASALDKTHAAGVVHRDLKPENLFVARRDDGTPKIKILDFGIAKVVSESTDAAKTKVLGTPLYMSPEQIRGDGTINPRADLYALGHMAFALIVGEAYWAREAEKAQLYALMLKICAGKPETASTMAKRYSVDLPEAFDEWFEQATAVEPHERFKTATALVQALAQVLGVPNVRMSIPEEPAPAASGSSGAKPRSDWKSAQTIDGEVDEKNERRESGDRGVARGPTHVTSGLPSVMVASQPSAFTDAALPKRSMTGPIAIGLVALAVTALVIRFMVASPAAPAPSAALAAPPAPSTAAPRASLAETAPSVSVLDSAPRADASATAAVPSSTPDAGTTLPDASLAARSPGLSPSSKPPTGKPPGKVPASQPTLSIE